MWSLVDTFLDPSPLQFTLQVGTTANQDADDWTDVGLPVVDQFVAFDPEQRVWGKTNWTHYRVRLVTSLGTYYSLPTGGMGTLDRRSWLQIGGLSLGALVTGRGPNLAQLFAISLHRLWRKTKGCGCGKAFDFARSLKLAPMCGNFLPVVVQFLRIARLHDCQHRLPAHWHFVHNRLKRATGTTVFRFQRTCARLEVKRWDRR